jgi:predicted ester cyclase
MLGTRQALACKRGPRCAGACAAELGHSRARTVTARRTLKNGLDPLRRFAQSDFHAVPHLRNQFQLGFSDPAELAAGDLGGRDAETGAWG